MVNDHLHPSLFPIIDHPFTDPSCLGMFSGAAKFYPKSMLVRFAIQVILFGYISNIGVQPDLSIYHDFSVILLLDKQSYPSLLQLQSSLSHTSLFSQRIRKIVLSYYCRNIHHDKTNKFDNQYTMVSHDHEDSLI